MSCTSPLYRVDAKKPGFLRLPSEFQAKVKNDGVFLRPDERRYLIDCHHFPEDLIQTLPCGQCTSCRLARSKTWAIRCMHEAQYHDYSIFVTLTYNDRELPRGEYLSLSGDIIDNSLRKKDMQDFIKRFRKYEFDTYGTDGLKVFYCGEYGELNDRPHYHAIIFGCHPFEDRYVWRKKDGFLYYRSPILERLWSVTKSAKDVSFKFPIGHVEFSDVSFDTCAYVARYCLKKITGKPAKEFREYYDTLEDPPPMRVEPFVCMSRRPGIGYRYAVDHFDDIYETDEVFYTKQFKAFASKPPRYYDKLFDVDHHEDLELLKETRVSSAIAAKSSIAFDGTENDWYRSRAVLEDQREKRRKVGL